MKAKKPTNGKTPLENSLPELQSIPLELIAEPKLPARARMDQDALEDLKTSLTQLGLLNPITVTKHGRGYQVVAGHRRYLAARELNWPSIRAFVYPQGWQDADAAMLHENIMREELNAAEEAIFIAQLIDKHKLDEAGLCKLLKRSPDYIGDRLELLRRDPQVFEALRQGKIVYSVARILNRWPDEATRRSFLDQAIRSGTSATVVQHWWDEWRAYHFPDSQRVNQDVPLPPTIPQESHGVECFVCGGYKDPYNLVTVMIHKWELAEMQRLLSETLIEVQNVARGQEPAEPESVQRELEVSK